MQKLCRNYVIIMQIMQIMQKLCKNYANKIMQKLCKNYAKIMQKLCNVPGMHYYACIMQKLCKLCKNYANYASLRKLCKLRISHFADGIVGIMNIYMQFMLGDPDRFPEPIQVSTA